jgi:glycosyltransferase involved in cell wall biosynthesis
MTRVDLHLHSRFSLRAEGWWIRRAGISHCYSDPLALYGALAQRGFDFFTLTDQHTIEGCLRLEGLPGVFNSEQVTALFPEDRVPVEVLVWGLTEAQHRDVLTLRSNVYELQSYLAQEELAHAVAHPFHHAQKGLQISHVERLVLLFSHFESLHGMRGDTVNAFASHFFTGLNPVHIDEMANRHGIAPANPRAWEKVFIGGSGARVGVFAGRAWTQSPASDGVAGFLSNVRKGLCEPAGKGGGPLTAAHSVLQNAAFELFQRRKGAGEDEQPRLPRVLSLFFDGKFTQKLSVGEKLKVACEFAVSGALGVFLRPSNAAFWRIVLGAPGKRAFLAQTRAALSTVEGCEEQAFLIVNQMVNWCCASFGREFIRRLASGDYLQALRDGACLVPVLSMLVPYFREHLREAPRLEWLREISMAVFQRNLAPVAVRRVAWFTDTLDDINGVSMTIRKLAVGAKAVGVDVVVICCRTGSDLAGVPMCNFQPVAEFDLPEYRGQRLSLPPVLQMVENVHREGFTEVVISTPGPVGLAGLLASRLLGLPAKGIYHTDFPRYVLALTEDSAMEGVAWKYMDWFFGGLDGMFVNSAPYRDEWIGRGIDPAKIQILPRGVDSLLFQPEKRDEQFWPQRGAAAGAFVLLYVGRVSREKDLDMLPELVGGLGGRNVVLAVVGDGPYRQELESILPQAIFTGVLQGKDLAGAYASADLFVFPSTTDTYGNVVAEALASGLPCVVSSAGGPAGMVKDGVTGCVTRARDQKDFVGKVLSLVDSPAKLNVMRQNLLSERVGQTWEEAAIRMFGV